MGDAAQAQRIVIEFSRDKAALVSARRWHPTQVIEHGADGSVVLAFTCTNLVPVVSWVLERGPHARVIEPPELVDMVVAELLTIRPARGPDYWIPRQLCALVLGASDAPGA